MLLFLLAVPYLEPTGYQTAQTNFQTSAASINSAQVAVLFQNVNVIGQVQALQADVNQDPNTGDSSCTLDIPTTLVPSNLQSPILLQKTHLWSNDGTAFQTLIYDFNAVEAFRPTKVLDALGNYDGTFYHNGVATDYSSLTMHMSNEYGYGLFFQGADHIETALNPYIFPSSDEWSISVLVFPQERIGNDNWKTIFSTFRTTALLPNAAATGPSFPGGFPGATLGLRTGTDEPLPPGLGMASSSADELEILFMDTDGAWHALLTQGANFQNQLPYKVTLVYNRNWNTPFKIYVNEDEIPTSCELNTCDKETIHPSSGTFLLGGDRAFPALNFVGALDDFKIYSRALTAEQVARDLTEFSSRVLVNEETEENEAWNCRVILGFNYVDPNTGWRQSIQLPTTESPDLSINTVTSGAGPGGSGNPSSGGGGSYSTFYFDLDRQTRKTVEMERGDILVVEGLRRNYYVRIDRVFDENRARFRVTPSVTYYSIERDSDEDIDLDKDGIYDVNIDILDLNDRIDEVEFTISKAGSGPSSTSGTVNNCGNGVCGSNESPFTCPVDCLNTQNNAQAGPVVISEEESNPFAQQQNPQVVSESSNLVLWILLGTLIGLILVVGVLLFKKPSGPKNKGIKISGKNKKNVKWDW